MLKMTDVTRHWMEHMISLGFPPLTPHHTQAFTVMMMSRFYGDYLRDAAAKAREEKPSGGWFSRAKLEVKAFIAQMATGEGKSIVIAMLAIFMVQLHGLKVRVLENDEDPNRTSPNLT